MALPPFVAAVLLLAAALGWTFALLSWVAWERWFESPRARHARLERRGAGKGGPDLLDVLGFGIPAVVPAALAIDGLLGSRWVFYSPAWSLFFPRSEVIQTIGAALLLVALLLFTAGAYLTGKYVFSKVSEERKLLRTGPYRFVRHPIYLAFGMLAVGYILLALNYLAFPCLVLLFNWGWRAEDEELAKQYGDEYLEYRSRTGAFLPRFRRHT